MDTYKRSIRGLQSRSNGEHFEGMILAASRFYEERGIAAVDKTPEAEDSDMKAMVLPVAIREA